MRREGDAVGAKGGESIKVDDVVPVKNAAGGEDLQPGPKRYARVEKRLKFRFAVQVRDERALFEESAGVVLVSADCAVLGYVESEMLDVLRLAVADRIEADGTLLFVAVQAEARIEKRDGEGEKGLRNLAIPRQVGERPPPRLQELFEDLRNDFGREGRASLLRVRRRRVLRAKCGQRCCSTGAPTLRTSTSACGSEAGRGEDGGRRAEDCVERRGSTSDGEDVERRRGRTVVSGDAITTLVRARFAQTVLAREGNEDKPHQFWARRRDEGRVTSHRSLES